MVEDKPEEIKRKKTGLWGFLFNQGLGRTLMIWFLLLSLIPITVISAISYMHARSSLLNSIREAQNTTIALKTAFVDNWFYYRFLDLESQATNMENIILLEKLRDAFQASGKDIGDFVGSYRWTMIVEKLGVDLKTFRRLYDYYDVFLIDSDGNILFTAIGKPDLGTNLFNGPYANTLFARSCKQSLESGRDLFSDYELYAPSNYNIAGFLTSPVVDEEGNKIGIFAMQVNIDIVNKIMQDRRGQGKTGETFLIGGDLLIRSNTMLHKEEVILKTLVDTEQTRMWHKEHIAGTIDKEEESIFVYKNHRGEQVLGTHSYVGIGEIRWGLVEEIETAEVFAPIRQLRNTAMIFGGVTGIIVIVVALVISRRIVNPLLKLTSTVGLIRSGRKGIRAEAGIRNEIGVLATEFNSMIDALDKSRDETLKSRDMADGILKSIADGLIVTDIYNRVVLMNRTAEDMLEIRLSEVVGREIAYAIKNRVLREKVKDALSKKTTGYTVNFELPGDNPEHPRIIRARTSVIYDYRECEKGIVTILTDITRVSGGE